MRRDRWAGAALGLWLVLGLFVGCKPAFAAGARYVTGPPFFTAPAGQPVGWQGPVLGYWTDPGPLSQYVTHAQADGLVAAAASVWNLPVASLTVQQAGELAEDVSGANVYVGASGVVFPADVMSANRAAIPLAVVYDADGAVTDTLLGSGASAPVNCRQNGVTETVDGFDPAGYITHAIVIVNGRCTGAAAEAQLQLQYQLERVFGRVLGLAWSQANDNVYTGTPQPTYQQALHWPLLHPLDIVCGPYTYQCLPQPFTLRPDDIAAMVLVYPVAANDAGGGKQASLGQAFAYHFPVQFPTGEGMTGVNILAQAMPGSDNLADPWVDVAAVSGGMFRRNATSPFVAADTSAQGSFGAVDGGAQQNVYFPYLPIVDGLPYGGVQFTSEAVNPLYVGAYSVGPYARGAVSPSGAGMPAENFEYVSAGVIGVANAPPLAGAAAGCSDGSDGAPGLPAPVPAQGWWNQAMCGYGHASYVSATVQPGRTLTLEVTALDATGAATTAKMMPVIGAFAPTDAAGALPSLGVAAAAFNGLTLGTTSLKVATGQWTSVTLGIADQRNDGRPDFSYQARLFYADSLAPAVVSAGGAQVVIRGMGFRAGNRVTVNGVTAQATAWTDTTITVTLPTMAAAGAQSGLAVDVVVSDSGTGATSTMPGVLTYVASGGAPPPALQLVSAPTGALLTGSQAAVPFALKEVAADGVTVLAGETLVLAVANGAGTLSVCGAASCTVTTDANGMVSTYVTPVKAGTVTLTASDAQYAGLSLQASFTATAAPGALTVWDVPQGPVYATQTAGQGFGVTVWTQGPNVQGYWGMTVRYSVVSGGAVFAPCYTSVCDVTSNGYGNAWVAVTPTQAGPLVIQASVGGLSQQVSLTVLSWADSFQVLGTPTPSVVAGSGSGSLGVRLVHGDGVTPDALEQVTFTGPANVVFGCGANVCTAQTGTDGSVWESVGAAVPGTYTIQAAFGGLVQTATFTVLAAPPGLTILSAPVGPVPVGTVASPPFTVRLTDTSGAPLAYTVLLLTGLRGDVILNACGGVACTVATDGNGMASTTVTPLVAGTIGLEAVSGSVTANASFEATGVMRTLVAVAVPGAAGAQVGKQQTFQFKLLGPDGVTPVPNETIDITVRSGSMPMAYCGFPVCRFGTDGAGILTFFGAPVSTGPILVQLTDEAYPEVTQTLTFNGTAAPAPLMDQLSVVSAPLTSSPVGATNATPFGVQVLHSNGSPAQFTTVLFSVPAGSAALSGCGSLPCAMTTDGNGFAYTLVTGWAQGLVTLQAVEVGGNTSNLATASFTVGGPSVAAAPAAELMELVTAPGTSVALGAAAVTPFAVRVTKSDGVTPLAGVTVTFAAAAGPGTVELGACGAATCTVTTDALGLAATTLTGVSVGEVILGATAASPGAGLAAPIFTVALTVVSEQGYSVVPGQPEIFVATGMAAGPSMPLALNATALEDGLGVLGLPVVWSSLSAAVTLGSTQTVSGAAGGVTTTVSVSGLGEGASATVSACLGGAFSGLGCGSFQVNGVAASDLALAALNGGAQTVAASTAYAPVVMQVSDGLGHPVAGALVTVYETVTAATQACPATGRCPAAPVIGSTTVTLTSDANGQVTVQPLTATGQSSSTRLAFAAGTQGWATAVLWSGIESGTEP